MSEPNPAPEPVSQRLQGLAGMVAKVIGALILVAAVAGGAAWGVFSYRIQQTYRDTTIEVAALRAELRQQQDELAERVQVVQTAAEEAKLLLSQSGETTTLEARLKEIDTIKLDLKKTQDEMAAKLQDMEKSVVEQVAKQGKETAQALSLELRWKSLLIKAQGEILLAQVQWTEGNRGLAKDELNIAAKTLAQAMTEAPEVVRADLRPVVDLAEQAKAALILEQSSARDALNLLWHRVSDLLATRNP